MMNTNNLVSINRHGINNDNIGPIAKASFEETSECFTKAANTENLMNLLVYPQMLCVVKKLIMEHPILCIYELE